MKQITTRLFKGKLGQQNFYKSCTFEKYVKLTFHDRDNKEHADLERVHFNVCGPFSITSSSRNKYFVTFIHDFSSKWSIFFMWKKHEAFSKFVEFKELVEKETRKKVKALKSDNGGEYVLNDFKDLCVKEGI